MIASNLLFIPPGRDLDADDPDIRRFALADAHDLIERWNTPKGQSILAAWEQSGYDRDTLNTLVGRFYGQTDLRGITLTNKDLSDKDLSQIDFYNADLHGTKFQRANLSNTQLTAADIQGASFQWATLDGVLLDEVKYDSSTSFLGVDLNRVNFTLAAMVQDMAITQNRIATMERENPYLSKVLKWTCDYGRAFARFLSWCVGIVVAFALFYFATQSVGRTNHTLSFLDSLYFSTVAFTTLGFGDILPLNWIGQVALIIEVGLGYLMLGLLVAILSRRVFGP